MKIICLGDSLTAGCGLRRGENWVELLREQTGDEWINAGVCGDTSTGILVRLQTEVLPQPAGRGAADGRRQRHHAHRLRRSGEKRHDGDDPPVRGARRQAGGGHPVPGARDP